MKTLGPAAQAEVLMHAATFFGDVFGDTDGAAGYLEKVLAIAPGHAAAFARLEAYLVAESQGLKLSELYAAAAAQRSDRAEQLALLRRAVEILDGFAGEEERAFKLYQQILKLDPADAATRRTLEARYASAGRLSDVAKLLEQALVSESAGAASTDAARAEGSAPEAATAIRVRLIELYAGELKEIERSMPHVEEVLRAAPDHPKARAVASELVGHKAVAARAAAALEAAHERLGEIADVAQMLAVQVEHLRGPRRVDAQKRLAALKQDALGDPAGAFTLLEAVLATDPADDGVRARHRALAEALDKRPDAARALQRAITGVKDPALRARLGAELGEIWLELGDPKKARAVFQTVLDAGGDEGAVLRASRALRRAATESREHRVLAAVLDRLSQIEPEPAARSEAARELARLCEGELKDPAGAVVAWRRLIDTPEGPQALEALERLHEAAGQHAELVGVLERRALLAKDRSAARALAFRAAELRSARPADRAGALAAWRALLETYGPARDAHARVIPMLEQERRWDELATTLAAEAALAPKEERAALMGRLAHVRLTRLSDTAGALDAFRQALAIDPADRAVRLAVEKLLGASITSPAGPRAPSDARLVAAGVLEPLYRAESSAAGLLRVLETRALLEPEVGRRLGALDEATTIAERDLGDPKRALELAGRALFEAAAERRQELGAWLERVGRLGAAGDAARRASILGAALGDREVDDAAMAELARRAGEALVLAGDVAQALAVLRRALAFQPSAELYARVDALLAEQGSPAERVTLYEEALRQPCAPERRRELLHAIAAIQRRDLGELDAAVATYRRALDDDAADRVAFDGLLEAHAAAGAWDALYDELARGLEARAGAPDGERAALVQRMAEASAAGGNDDRAAAHYRELMALEPAIPEPVLDAALGLAEATGDAALGRAVLERRVDLALEQDEELVRLEQLGDALAGKLGDPAAAASALGRAARLAEAAGDDARALGLWERVLAAAAAAGSEPAARDAALRLVELYTRAGAWERLPPAYAVLLRSPGRDAEALDLLLAFEAVAVRAGAIDGFLDASAGVLARLDASDAPAAALLAARARVLAADPARAVEAAAAYRQACEAPAADAAAALDAFEAFLGGHPATGSLAAERRWLFARRVELADEGARGRALYAWAAAEELADPEAALEVYARVLALEPGHDGALAATARLRLALGDAEGAAQALAARRDASEGPARAAIAVELAVVLLDRLGRPDEAVAAIAPVLEAALGADTPTAPDAAALRIAERALAWPVSRAAAAALIERVAESIGAAGHEPANEDADPAAGGRTAVALYRVLLATPADAPETRASRSRWYEHVLEREAGDPPAAAATALAAVAELPGEEALWERAERLGREASRPEIVAAAYRAALGGVEARGLGEEALERLGQRAVEFHEEWFDEPDTVVGLLERLVELAPGSAWAFDRLKLLFNAAERWDDLFALYDRAIARASDAHARAALLDDAAQTAKDFAGDLDRAVGYFEALAPLRPGEARVTAALERLYERLGRWRPLIALCEAELGAASGDAAQRLRARIAALWIDGVGDAGQALAVIEAMLAADPARADAFDLLEKVLVQTQPSPAAEPRIEAEPDAPAPTPKRKGEGGKKRSASPRHRAAALLRDRYRAASRPADLVRVLAVELEAATTAKDRVKRLREIIALQADALGDLAGALESVALLVSAEPKVAEHRKELAALALRTERFDRHAEVLAAVAARCDDKKLKIKLLSEAAEVHRERLHSPDRAIELGRLVFELAVATGDGATALATARELDGLLAGAQGRRRERCEVLEHLADLEQDLGRRRAALGEAARIARAELGDPARAARALYRRLDELGGDGADSPGGADLEALDALVEALGELERWDELLRVLERRAEAAPGGGRADRAQIARVLGERLGDRERAIAAWLAVRERYGADDESADALARLYEEGARWGELAALYAAEADAASGSREADRAAGPPQDPPRRGRAAELWRRLGDVHATHTGRLEDAVRGYERSLALDPRGAASRRGLEAVLARLTDEPAAAASAPLGAATRALAALYAANGDSAALVALTEPRLAAAEDDAARVGVLLEAARLHRELGDAAQAFEAAWRALALAVASTPGREIEPSRTPGAAGIEAAAGEVVRLASESDRWDLVAASLPAVLATGPVPPGVGRELHWYVALWHRDAAKDRAAAEAALERALACEPPPGEEATAREIAILGALADLQRPARSRPLVDTLLRLADATGGDPALCREAAEVALDPLGDRALGGRIAERLLSLSTARWTHPTHQNTRREAGDPRAPSNTGPEAGDPIRASRGAGSPDDALEPSAAAAAWALDVLGRLAAEAGDTGEVIALHLRAAALPFPAAERRRRRLLAAELADPDRAIALYAELLDDDARDEAAARRLEELYRARGASAELVALRERQIGVAPDAASRAALRLDAAAIRAAAGDTDGAIAALAQSLVEVPGHAASAARLAELYEASGRHEALARLFEEQAGLREAASDAAGAAELWSRAARLCEAELGDPARAALAHERAAGLGDSCAAGGRARPHAARGDHAASARALERALAAAPPARAAAILVRLAEAYLAAGDRAAAADRLDRAAAAVTAVAPKEAADVRARLAELYRQAEAWGPLAALVAAEAAHAPDKATRVARLREAADLHLGRRGDAASAIPLLEQAADLAPDDVGIRREQSSALCAAGRLDDAGAVLRQVIAAFGGRRPKERALVHFELANVSLASGDRARALGELDVALRIDPAHPEILHALAKLALEEGQLERASRTLRALLLVKRPDAAADRATPSRGEILLELAAIAERQGEAERAAEFVESALEAARSGDAERERLFAMLRARARHDVLARGIEQRLAEIGAAAAAPAPAPSGADEVARLCDELADLYETHLGRAADALDARLRALALAPGSSGAHEAALDLARRAGRVDRYLEAVRQLVGAVSDPVRTITLRVCLGRARESAAGGDRAATEEYLHAERLLEEAAARGQDDRARLDEVRHALERAYARLGDVEAQASVLEKRFAEARALGLPPAEQADPLYRLAALRLPDKEEEAASLLESALELDAQPDRAEAALRAALEKSPRSERIARLLERLARRSGRPRALVDALVLLADLEGSTADLREAVSVARSLGDHPLGESILRRVLAAEPGGGAGADPWALLALAEIRAAAGDLAEAASLEEAAARRAPPDQERELLLHVASLAAGPLGDLERAARLYDELRRREPADRDAWEPLAEVYRKLGDAPRLSALIEDTVPLVDGVAERGRLRLERARILMAADEPAATDLLREIVEEDPNEIEAGRLLAAMLERAGRVDELCELYARQLDAAKDREDQASIVALSTRLGALLEQRGDDHGALDVYHAALDWDPEGKEPLRAIVRLSLKRDDSIDLGDALDKLLAVEEGDEAARVAWELGELKTAHGDEEGALAAMERGHAACPSSEKLRDELTRRYTARGAWPELAAVLVRDAGARAAIDDRVGVLCHAADVLRDQAGDVAGAAAVLTTALEADPSNRDVLMALVDACAALGEHERAAGAVTAILAQHPDDASLYRSRAELRQASGRDDLALADLEAAHEKSDGGFAGELTAEIERCLARLAAGEDAAAVSGGKGERELRLRLAEVLGRAGETDRARGHLSDLVRKDSKDRVALRRLAALEDAASRWDASSATYRRLLALEDGEALVETALRLADSCEKGDRLADARGALERALRVAPHDGTVRRRLAHVYNVTGASRELAALVLEDAAAAPDVAGRHDRLLYAGRLLLDAGDEAARAVLVLEEARGLEPEDDEGTLLLGDAYAAAGRKDDAIGLLRQAAARYKGRRSRALAAIHRKISRIELNDGDLSEALSSLVRAFDADPQSGVVAMELGLFAIDLDDQEIASRAFRSVTLMKLVPEGGESGTTAAARALAYFHLASIARLQGDRRKARLMVDKAVADDPTLEAARALLEELRAG